MNDIDFTPALQADYAPRRKRGDRQEVQEVLDPTPLPPATNLSVPLSDEIKDTALRFSTMVGNLQESERRTKEENAELKARIEQFQSAVTELKSQLESSRLETQEANRRTDEQRTANTRLKSILENLGGLIADGLQE